MLSFRSTVLFMSDRNEFGAPRGTMAYSNHVCDSTPCFNFLHGTMPRDITPSDMDGITEINGRFWDIEFKKTGKAVPKGQELMFKRLVDTGWCVSIIWHDGLTRENKFTKAIHLIPFREPQIRVFKTYGDGIRNIKAFAKWWSSYQIRSIG